MLWNLKAYYLIHKNHGMDPDLSSVNVVCLYTLFFFPLICMFKSLKWSFSLQFSDRNFVYYETAFPNFGFLNLVLIFVLVDLGKYSVWLIFIVNCYVSEFLLVYWLKHVTLLYGACILSMMELSCVTDGRV